jgi:hypothetical protein
MSTITKPSRSERAFISKAPDAKPAPTRRRPTAASTQITVILADEVLARLDEMARETGQSRAGLIKVGITRVLRDGV